MLLNSKLVVILIIFVYIKKDCHILLIIVLQNNYNGTHVFEFLKSMTVNFFNESALTYNLGPIFEKNPDMNTTS